MKVQNKGPKIMLARTKRNSRHQRKSNLLAAALLNAMKEDNYKHYKKSMTSKSVKISGKRKSLTKVTKSKLGGGGKKLTSSSSVSKSNTPKSKSELEPGFLQKCPACGKQYRRSGWLNNHMLLQHKSVDFIRESREGDWKCKFHKCSHKTSNKYNAIRHVDTVHLKEIKRSKENEETRKNNKKKEAKSKSPLSPSEKANDIGKGNESKQSCGDARATSNNKTVSAKPAQPKIIIHVRIPAFPYVSITAMDRALAESKLPKKQKKGKKPRRRRKRAASTRQAQNKKPSVRKSKPRPTEDNSEHDKKLDDIINPKTNTVCSTTTAPSQSSKEPINAEVNNDSLTPPSQSSDISGVETINAEVNNDSPENAPKHPLTLSTRESTELQDELDKLREHFLLQDAEGTENMEQTTEVVEVEIQSSKTSTGESLSKEQKPSTSVGETAAAQKEYSHPENLNADTVSNSDNSGEASSKQNDNNGNVVAEIPNASTLPISERASDNQTEEDSAADMQNEAADEIEVIFDGVKANDNFNKNEEIQIIDEPTAYSRKGSSCMAAASSDRDDGVPEKSVGESNSNSNLSIKVEIPDEIETSSSNQASACENKYTCKVCKNTFPTIESRRRHVRINHRRYMEKLIDQDADDTELMSESTQTLNEDLKRGVGSVDVRDNLGESFSDAEGNGVSDLEETGESQSMGTRSNPESSFSEAISSPAISCFHEEDDKMDETGTTVEPNSSQNQEVLTGNNSEESEGLRSVGSNPESNSVLTSSSSLPTNAPQQEDDKLEDGMALEANPNP